MAAGNTSIKEAAALASLETDKTDRARSSALPNSQTDVTIAKKLFPKRLDDTQRSPFPMCCSPQTVSAGVA